MKRRNFLAASAACLLGPRIASATSKPSLRIGLVADPQYADIDTLGSRFYRQSIGKLTEAVESFNQQDLAWCVNLGDLIDKHWSSFDEIMKPLNRSKHRFYHVLGNHDFDVARESKPNVPERLKMLNRYYAVEQDKWIFLMLDTTDVSLYRFAEGTPEYEQANEVYQQHVQLKQENAKPWNGAIGDDQLKWIDKMCRSASETGRRVIALAHHPICPSEQHNAWNATRILETLARHRCVVGWFNGHNHAGAFGEHEEIPFVTMQGMVETESTNSFAVAEIHADRLVLTGHGREPSRELKFRS